MKKSILAGAAALVLTLPTAVWAANPTYGVDVVTEYTKISNIPAVYEETLRLRIDYQANENMYMHVRAKGHAINNKAFDSIDRSFFDQAYAGYKTQNFDIRGGKQPLYLGHGLLADLNVSGVQATVREGNAVFLGFASNDVKALNATVSSGKSSVGVTYKKQTDSTWGLHADLPVGKAVLGSEYVHNTTNKQHGYITSLTSGQYALSYRVIQQSAIDPAWATNYHYADSKGFRLRGDFKMNPYSILTVYQDIAKNYAGTLTQNITYIGYAMYF